MFEIKSVCQSRNRNTFKQSLEFDLPNVVILYENISKKITENF